MITITIQAIEYGIVFLMAQWSGGAKWAYGQLLPAMEQRGIPVKQLHVFDVDLHSGLYDMPELTGRIHGWGETAVVRGGKIVFVTVLGEDKSRIEENCDELFKAYDS